MLWRTEDGVRLQPRRAGFAAKRIGLFLEHLAVDVRVPSGRLCARRL
ncbi:MULTISPECIES: hypothetical protein [unclassified Streptomyces]|nr:MULTISPECIES: hypothetical protein [unclassified Streptomyces]MCX5063786.1 hypothetical protein [Streptomyces sp. NBC_00452]MCX5294156.1 hypothetical protein [Streptomyces sp. NBC_00183]